MNCYFCHRPLPLEAPVRITWRIPRIKPRDGSFSDRYKEHAHLECLEAAQRLFERCGQRHTTTAASNGGAR